MRFLPNIPPEYAGGRELATRDALELGEWNLILHDLETALGNIEVLMTVYNGPDMPKRDHVIAEALYRDAVVQFVGCFDDDPRKCKLSKGEVYRDVPNGLDAMKYLQDLRDTFAAHNFGPMRQCYLIVMPGELASAFRPLRLTYSLPIPDLLPEYATLIRAAMKAATDKILALHEKVVAHLGELGAAGIGKLPLVSIRTAQPHEMRQSRASFRSGSPPRGHGGPGH